MIKYLVESESKYEKNSRIKYFQRQFDLASNLYSKNLKAHFSCVNAIEFSNSSELFASAGDDKRLLIWNINKDILSNTPKNLPTIMKGQHNSNIFTLEFDNEDQKIFSGGNDHQVIVHDIKTQEICDIFLHENSVLCISVHPKQSCIFATACESGQLSLYDLRCSVSDPILLASTTLRSRSFNISDSDSSSSSSSSSQRSASIHEMGGAFNSCHFNPVDSNLIVAANEINGISLIDIRMNQVILRYKSSVSSSSSSSCSSDTDTYKQNVMSVRFNRIGTQLIALRAKLRPALYDVNKTSPVCLFDDEEFRNSCTLKSCCYAGDRDQYLVSGSDDFNVYIWKIPSISFINSNETQPKHLVSETHLKLRGHRSIVNQCRFNLRNQMLATCGIEKLIKIWTPYTIPNSSGGLKGIPEEYQPSRPLYTFNDLFSFRWSNELEASTSTTNQVNTSNLTDQNDIAIMNYQPVISNRSTLPNNESTDEDRIMIAYFDSQVRRQRKIEETISSIHDKKVKKRNQEEEIDDLIFLNDEEEENDINLSNSESSSNESTSSSSSSSSSETMDSSDDAEDGLDINKLKRKYESNNKSSVKKRHLKCKQLIPLRDRLRNLRHRRSLNLTQETDYINVLDSLNVEVNNENNSNDENSLKEARNKMMSASSIEIGNESEKEQSNKESIQSLPCTSKQSNDTKTLVKKLNNQKRKIELNEDDELSERKKSEPPDDNDDDDTNSPKVEFKKANKSKKG